MTSMTSEKEQEPKGSTTPDVPVLEPVKKSDEGSMPPSSVAISGLGSGQPQDVDLDDENDNDDDDVFYDIEPSSGEQLQSLAKPKVFKGPNVELAQTIVDALEEGIEELDPGAKKAWDDGMALLTEESKKFNEVPHTEEEREAFKVDITHRQRMLPASKYAVPLLYVGSIVLTDIPGTDEDETDLFDSAKLIGSSDHALGGNLNASALPKHAGVENQLIWNTLKTMVMAGQISYLRKAGFVGKGWKIVIEVHYYRDRTGAGPTLHKDTLGQTLFVNLNYTNQTPMPGPEFVSNPPLEKTHEDYIGGSLPQQFLDDLDETRKAPLPKVIETEELPAYGVVAFVDEAIHHATPMVGFREVTIANLKKFLQEDGDFKALYAAAVQAFTDSQKQGKWAKLPWWSFKGYFTSGANDAEKNMWGALMGLCAKEDTVNVNRKILLAAGMSHDQIDRLLAAYGPSSHHSVGIPSRARTDGSGSRTRMLGTDGKPLPLRRTMSMDGLKDKWPQELPEGTPRRFFRTWVRAVRNG